jgi:hypothetical protein
MISAILLSLSNIAGVSQVEAILQEVVADQVNAGEAVQKPASETDIIALIEAMRLNFAAKLPDDYIQFLKQKNGLDYNGLVIYGSNQSPENRSDGQFWQGLVATNLLWRKDQDLDYVIIGETEMDILTIDQNGSAPTRRDRVSGDIIATYTSTSSMIETLLRERL